MRFTTIGSLHVATRVTGPTHHLLGLELTRKSAGPIPTLESVSIAAPDPRSESWEENEPLRREVLEGVEEMNRRLESPYFVKNIRFCRDDCYVPGVYRRMTQALIDHLEA